MSENKMQQAGIRFTKERIKSDQALLDAHYGAEFYNQTGSAPEDCTCYDCNSRALCPFAWDAYNSSGDCLAEK